MRDGDNDRHQSDGENDEIIADLHDRALKMADGLRLPDQLGCFTKVSVRAGGIHQCIYFAATHDRA